MIRNSIRNGCKNFYLHRKFFKITFKSDCYLMSICRRGTVKPSSHTFCRIDVTQMAYWCSQKAVACYENLIRNLEPVLKLFWNTVWLFGGWFICFLSSYSLEYSKGRSKLSELCVSMSMQVNFGLCKTCSYYNIYFKYEANIGIMKQFWLNDRSVL